MTDVKSAGWRLNQWLFRHCAPGEAGDGSYVFGQEFSSFAQIGGGFEVSNAKKLSIFPNCGGSIVRSDATWIGPGMNRDKIRGHRRGNMHRAAIDADDERSRPYEPDQLQERRLVGQIHTILRCRKSSSGFADDNDASGREGTTKFQNRTRPNRFFASSSVRMKNNKSGKSVKARRNVTTGNGKTQILAQGRTECLR